MSMKTKMAKTIMLAGIPFLAFPFLAESGMSQDWSQRDDRARGQSFDNQKIVQGEISKKNGDEITLRASNGERITFRINDQTNQLCPKGTQTSQTSSMSNRSSGNQNSSMGHESSTETSTGQGQMAKGSGGQSSSDSGQTSSSSLFGSQNVQASDQSSSQGTSGDQTNSRQAQQGFRFGECNFQNGEFVKAKVDEKGNASFVRSMGNSDEYYGTAGAGGEYFVLPAGQLGGLDISDKDANYSVKTNDGQEIGSIYRVMTNGDGDMTYAIMRKKDGQLISVPWQALEGSGNKSFKLKVTQNQLGNLPILQEGESAGAHVQKHWDLTEQQRQDLAKWNERLDERNRIRDRYTEDTPTFYGNRKGYDRYDSDRGQQGQYQDQSFDDSQVRHYGFSPSEFPPPNQAPQYERDDRQGSFDRNRQGRSSNDYRDRGNQQYSRSQDENFNSGDRYYRNQSRSNMRNYDSDDYRNRGNQQSMYSQSRERNYSDPMDRLSDRYNTTTSRSQYDSQRQGADQYQSRRSGGKDYDYRPEGYRP